MKTIKFNEPKVIYEVVGKNSDGDWETIENKAKTLEAARERAKEEITKEKWISIDINLIIDNDLIETYDENGKVR